MLVDVAHVYSTLYRTYFDPIILTDRKTLLRTTPIILFLVSVVVYTLSPKFYWTVLAYTAVFHFIRQQFGFIRIYSRKENISKYSKIIDTLSIYSATLYPIIHWHCSGAKNFSWMIENDFKLFYFPQIDFYLSIIYGIIFISYVIKEGFWVLQMQRINIPKNLFMLGTYISWYMGIVAYNSDLVFTMFNVLSHGIPYIALVWMYQLKIHKPQQSVLSSKLFNTKNILIFLGSLFLFAYLEEYFWDVLVWKDHQSLFPFSAGSALSQNSTLLSLIVPLLSLPQLTHYILDAYIWKTKSNESTWNKVLVK